MMVYDAATVSHGVLCSGDDVVAAPAVLLELAVLKVAVLDPVE